MKATKIWFNNRDRNLVEAVRVGEENWWQLRINNSNKLTCSTIGFEDDGTIFSVDPPGGPFLCIGTKTGAGVIKEIKNTSLGIYILIEP